jgi:hypothetical protein
MNAYQERWWQQVRSDFGALVLLRQYHGDPCHQLHYLQMVTEKLGKAYFWRKGIPPRFGHAYFVWFLRSLGTASSSNRHQIADVFRFRRFDDFQNWVKTVLPLAYALQRLAPDLAKDGPNTEYPWPSAAPEFVPATYRFELWQNLTGTGRGRQLMSVIRLAVEQFPVYA